jgi:hypothetical protein
MSNNLEKLKQIIAATKEQDVDTKELQQVPCAVPDCMANRENMTPSVTVVSSTKEIDAEEDYKYIRNNMRDLINKGSEALDNLIHVADESEKAFAYTAVSTLLKALVDTNKELIELQKTMTSIKTNKGEDKNSGTTNIKNAVFVGNSSELNEMMKKKKKDDEIF